MHGLDLLVVFLAVVVLAVAAFRLFNLPPVLGYLSVGLLVGPHGLQMISDVAGVAHLSELGIVLLMFTIGLEFSLPKLHAMRKTVLGLGGMQVAGTVVICSALGGVLHWSLPSSLQMTWAGWLAVGGVLAMSSTAIVMKILTEKMALDTAHGRNIFGVLLFQDLAVVPLLILFPVLAQLDSGTQSASSAVVQLVWGLIKTILVLFVLLRWGQRPMHAWLTMVVKRRSSELFMLNLFLMTLLLAWLTDKAGLSMALGAFVAGMLISETEFKVQVEEDIEPFKDIFLGLFFIAMGMMLDVRFLTAQFVPVVLILVAFLLIKLVWLVWLVLRMGDGAGVAIRTALALAPAGEFGLVLLNLAGQQHLILPPMSQWLLASILLSMFTAPLLMKYADAIAYRFTRNEWLMQSLQLTHVAAHSIDAHDHVIIAGFGRSGKALARLLREQGVAYMGIDCDPDTVQRSILKGHDVVYGDITRRESLIAAGVDRAKTVVVTYSDPRAALHLLHHLQALAPQVPVIVRTLDDAYLEQLQNAGAVAVVPEILEGSLVLATQTLLVAGTSGQEVWQFIAQQRSTRYDLLRQHLDEGIDPFGISSATPEAVAKTQAYAKAALDEAQSQRVDTAKPIEMGASGQASGSQERVVHRWVTVTDESLWSDQVVSGLPLSLWKVQVASIKRGAITLDMSADPTVREADAIEFVGLAADVEHAVLALNGQV